MSGGAILRVKKLTGPDVVRLAAAHNKRTIQAELGSEGGSINSARTHLNECLSGPSTPTEVAGAARDKMAAAGIVKKLRKDAVRTIEFVVSLAPGNALDERAFFAAAVVWLAGQFGGMANVLSADIHRDEAAPHMHLLLIPLINGRMVGSDALGGRAKLKALKMGFAAEVCRPFGLEEFTSKLVGEALSLTVAAVLAELKRRCDPCLQSTLWPAIRDCIEADPTSFAASMGLAVDITPKPKKLRTMTQIFTSPGKGSTKREEPANPIGFAVASARNPIGFAGEQTPNPMLCRVRDSVDDNGGPLAATGARRASPFEACADANNAARATSAPTSTPKMRKFIVPKGWFSPTPTPDQMPGTTQPARSTA